MFWCKPFVEGDDEITLEDAEMMVEGVNDNGCADNELSLDNLKFFLWDIEYEEFKRVVMAADYI